MLKKSAQRLVWPLAAAESRHAVSQALLLSLSQGTIRGGSVIGNWAGGGRVYRELSFSGYVEFHSPALRGAALHFGKSLLNQLSDANGGQFIIADPCL